MAETVAERLVQTLIEAGVRRVYGIVGDSLNPVTDAIRRSGTVAEIGTGALKLGFVTAEQFDEWVRPEDMTHPLR